MSQQAGSYTKPLGLPSTKWRAPAAQRGYFEDKASQLALTRDVTVDSSGRTISRTSALYVPQARLEDLERTLAPLDPDPPVDLPDANDEPSRPPAAPPLDEDTPTITHSIKVCVGNKLVGGVADDAKIMGRIILYCTGSLSE